MTVIRKQYIIEMPFTLNEYNICQLYTVADMSRSVTKGDVGVEILENVDFTHEVLGNCRKTHKVMYLNSHVPSAIRAVLPKKSLILDEISYNSFPKCITTYTNRIFSQDRFLITVESQHKEGEFVENIMNLSEKEYKKFEKDYIKINEPAEDKDYDPSKFEKRYDRKIGSENPRMFCYKNVTIKFDVWGFGWISYELERQLRKIFLSSHQRMYCTMEKWNGLTIEDIRNIENETKEILESKITNLKNSE